MLSLGVGGPYTMPPSEIPPPGYPVPWACICGGRAPGVGVALGGRPGPHLAECIWSPDSWAGATAGSIRALPLTDAEQTLMRLLALP